MFLNLILGFCFPQIKVDIILFQLLNCLGGISTGSDWKRKSNLGSVLIFTASIHSPIFMGSSDQQFKFDLMLEVMGMLLRSYMIDRSLGI